jgi:hypothetical protein
MLLIPRNGLGGRTLYFWNSQNRAACLYFIVSSNFEANFLLLPNFDANI